MLNINNPQPEIKTLGQVLSEVNGKPTQFYADTESNMLVGIDHRNLFVIDGDALLLLGVVDTENLNQLTDLAIELGYDDEIGLLEETKLVNVCLQRIDCRIIS